MLLTTGYKQVLLTTGYKQVLLTTGYVYWSDGKIFFCNTFFDRTNKFYRLALEKLTLWMLSSSAFRLSFPFILVQTNTIVVESTVLRRNRKFTKYCYLFDRKSRPSLFFTALVFAEVCSRDFDFWLLDSVHIKQFSSQTFAPYLR